jgi:photosystem II stability/assembly factor-like uncharacterized protein
MPMLTRRVLAMAVVLAAAAFAHRAATSAPEPFRDPLDQPAARNARLDLAHVNAISRAGSRLVAVGLRGLVVHSDGAGAAWRQADVPVASDLTAVQFIDAQRGWAVGHDGVVLHSADGGAHWVRQLDGRQAAELLTRHFTALVAAGEAGAAPLLELVRQNYAAGPEQALLGVLFEDALRGWACGSFGTLLRTRDGGATWESAMEHIDNPRALHLNALLQVGGTVLIASEQGTVFRLDAQRARFVPESTGYPGSFFGLAGHGHLAVAFGLRGTAYRSRDAGRRWERLSTGTAAGLNAGALLDDGTLALASQDGRVLLSSDEGDSFRTLAPARASPLTAIVPAGPGVAVIGGVAGLGRLALR